MPCQRRRRRCGALLPHHFTIAPVAVLRQQDAGAVYFLWHFPAGCPGWLLATTVPCPARTFLPRRFASQKRSSGGGRQTRSLNCLFKYQLRLIIAKVCLIFYFSSSDFYMFFEVLIIGIGEITSEVDAATFLPHLG